ncbi:MAG: UDP-N-acetylmuramoyl-L-alanyl-D-glutamate--2,6-diaminopimelate ligase [Bacteroidales bacterium]|nr:UDP-N-acetylmuramoyl-L-alanyl-D-glutamate--2,6-diaminopimelate ligase [Bacteroidales bacterium]
MKTLQDILYKADCEAVSGRTDINIFDITSDSRTVNKNSLFVAVRGTQTDGHSYIKKAIEKGAIAIICEELPEHRNVDITYILVKNSSKALGIAASNIYDNPSEKIKLIGITGTNGKTTTATLLYKLFSQLGYKAGLISTISIIIEDEIIPSTHTTPDAVKLNMYLAQMYEKGVTHCFMEVSSHAIEQERIAGLYFTGGAFTNITHDHLDYHLTFSNYIHAKKKFFDNLSRTSFAISNIDDKNGEVMLQNTKASTYYYGIKKMADFKAKINENLFEGLNLYINGHNAWFRLIGTFNAYNLLAVFSISSLLGEKDQEILALLSNMKAVEGRFEYIKNHQNITAIVDYAHTPDALKNVLDTINDIRTGNEQIISVIGCGGNRDKEKRPLMAKIASQKSNIVILTSDNPRFEEAIDIIEDMKKGLDVMNTKKILIIENRKEAIKTACVLGKEGDILLIAGKGHEKYQEIKGVKYPFDDMQVLKEFLTENQ